MSERTKVTAKKSETEKGNSAAYKRKSELSQSKNSPVDQILHLQETVGNQAVQRWGDEN